VEFVTANVDFSLGLLLLTKLAVYIALALTEVFLSQHHVRAWLDLINKSLIARHRKREHALCFRSLLDCFKTAPVSDYTGIVGATNAGRQWLAGDRGGRCSAGGRRGMPVFFVVF
jgi:hypothetical protein